MKRLMMIILSVALVVAATGCKAYYANAQVMQKTRDIADVLSRTPSNSIVEYESCGMFECVYNVCFTTQESLEQIGRRLSSGTGSLGLSVSYFDAYLGSGSVLEVINGTLPQKESSPKDRVTVTSGHDHNSAGGEWRLANQRGEDAAKVWFFATKDTDVTYAFGSKALSGNIIIVIVFVNPQKR